MKIKVRTAIKVYVIIAFLNLIASAVVHGVLLNKFLAITGLIGAIYLIVTIDIYEQLRRFNRNRKILSEDGTYIEAPEFRLLYYKLLGEYEKKIKTLRNACLNRMCLLIVPAIISVIITAAKFPDSNNQLKIYILLFIILVMIMIASKAEECRKKYIRIYKDEILFSFMKLINPNLEYNEFGAREKIEQIYRKSRLETMGFDYLKVDDIISGQISDKTYVDIANICAVDEYYTLNNRRKKRKVFEGLFSASKCAGEIKGTIKIKRQFKSVTKFEKKQKVELDNQTFEALYDVYCEDDNFAFRILTPDVMEKLTNLGKYGFDIEIAIKDSKICTRMGMGPMFEPSIIKGALDKDELYTYYCVIKFIVDLTESVNKSLETFVS